MLDGPSHLPAEIIAGSGYLRCRCRPAGNLAQDIAIRKLEPRQPSSGKVRFEASANTRAMATAFISNRDVHQVGGLQDKSDEDCHPLVEAASIPSMSLKSIESCSF